MRISDWSSDVCSSDLGCRRGDDRRRGGCRDPARRRRLNQSRGAHNGTADRRHLARPVVRSEEHTSELQSLMRISYAVFCLKKTNQPRAQRAKHSNSTTAYVTTPHPNPITPISFT